MNILDKAIAAHQENSLEEAEQLYLEHLKSSNDFTAKQLLGLVYSRLKKLDLAVKYMEESLSLQPGQPNVHNNIANCFKRQGDMARAVEHYRQAIALQPGYIDAYRNLALTLQQQDEFVQSEAIILQALSLSPEDASLHNLFGHIKKESRDYQGAIESYERSLAIRPDHAITEHNLGVVYRLNNQPQLALKHYQKLIQQDQQSFELFQNIGNAYADIGELDMAIDFYRKVIDLNPGYADAHRNLSALLWSSGRKEEFVESYGTIFSQNVISDALILTCAETLLAAEQSEAAFRHLETWQVEETENPNYLDFIARCHMAAGDNHKALHFHHLACRGNPSNAHQLHFGITLLQTGNVKQAADMLEHVFTVEPGNQFALSHLTLCWRLLGDEREAKVNNYEQLVGAYQLPAPKGFSSIIEFNQYLDEFLTRIHTSKQHPYEQTVRGGTQTQGNLFAWESEELQLLINSLTLCINQHLERISRVDPPFPNFPRSQYFDFSASWSVKLRGQGFHTMHVHPMGWFSSAYYVNLPDSMDKGNRDGWLKFGEPNFEPPEPLEPQYFIQPEAGKLALFPSYMWHGTVPFESDQLRTTVVFDIVPVEKH